MEVTPFEVSVNWEGEEPIIHIRGEIDFATAPALNKSLSEVIDRGARHLTLDFQQVSFLDSEGLKVILQTYRHLRAREGSMTVKGCSQFVARTFEILGFDKYIDMDHDSCKNS